MKNVLAVFRISIRALRRNVLRTLLTMLGIIIGVAAVIAMISIGVGANNQVERQIAALGQNVIMIMAGGPPRGGVFMAMGSSATLTVEDAETIRRDVEGVAYLSPEARGSAQVMIGSSNWNTSVMGENEDYLSLRSWPLADGEFFTDAEVRTAARVAVLGQTVAKKLFEDGNAIGATIRIQNAPFTVLGVLKAKGSNMMGQDQDDVIVVPYTTAMRRMFGQTTLRIVNVSADSAGRIASVQEQITELLRQRHRIQPGQDDDFNVRTQQEIAQFATSTTTIMTALLGSIASVSLLVGGIGIMNIMLVSVTERTREIGVRLAVGARKRDILRQFLLEATLLSAIGGVIGIALGVGASTMLAARMNWPVLTPGYAVVGAFLFSSVIGIFFGYYPARRAAQLDPIEALRYE